jgi:hypothetical protein
MTENNDSNDENNYTYCPKNYVDVEGRNGTIREGGWRREWREENRATQCGMMDMERPRGGRAAQDGKICRDLWKDYFNNEGSVDWQMAHCTQTSRVNPSQPAVNPSSQPQSTSRVNP